MIIPKTIVIFELDVISPETICNLNLILISFLQQFEELGVSTLKNFVIENHQDLLADYKKHKK